MRRLAAFKFLDKSAAEDLYKNKILKVYSNDTNSFREDSGYYEQNWLWFGAAFYNNRLENFED
jgi:hypothetical protein